MQYFSIPEVFKSNEKLINYLRNMVVFECNCLFAKPLEIEREVLKYNSNGVKVLDVRRWQDVINFYYAFVVDSPQNHDFPQRPQCQNSIDENVFVNFDCVDFFCLIVAHSIHFSIGAGADYAQTSELGADETHPSSSSFQRD